MVGRGCCSRRHAEAICTYIHILYYIFIIIIVTVGVTRRDTYLRVGTQL